MEDVVGAMVSWFHRHYTEAANCVPYVSADGGYQFWAGGPYDAEEVIREEFGDRFSEEAIDEAVGRIGQDGDTWVRADDY